MLPILSLNLPNLPEAFLRVDSEMLLMVLLNDSHLSDAIFLVSDHVPDRVFFSELNFLLEASYALLDLSIIVSFKSDHLSEAVLVIEFHF